MHFLRFVVLLPMLSGCYFMPVSYSEPLMTPAILEAASKLPPEKFDVMLRNWPKTEVSTAPMDWFEAVNREYAVTRDPVTGIPTSIKVKAGHKGDVEMMQATGAVLKDLLATAGGLAVSRATGGIIPGVTPSGSGGHGSATAPATGGSSFGFPDRTKARPPSPGWTLPAPGPEGAKLPTDLLRGPTTAADDLPSRHMLRALQAGSRDGVAGPGGKVPDDIDAATYWAGNMQLAEWSALVPVDWATRWVAEIGK